jgi:hypothetical protein
MKTQCGSGASKPTAYFRMFRASIEFTEPLP